MENINQKVIDLVKQHLLSAKDGLQWNNKVIQEKENRIKSIISENEMYLEMRERYEKEIAEYTEFLKANGYDTNSDTNTLS